MRPILAWLLAAGLTAGCATVVPNSPIPGDAAKTGFFVSSDLPDSKFLPQQSASVPDSQYVMVQAGGGSIFLGPVLGSMNISAKTQKMAEKYKDQYLGVNVQSIAEKSLSTLNNFSPSDKSLYVVKPFVFVQHCYDEKFRLSLVFHVEKLDPSSHWVGRYVYHLKTIFQVADFGSASGEQIANYLQELNVGATQLAALFRQDMEGRIPAIGRKANIGSLYIMGNKMGGTMPELLSLKNVDVVSEENGRVLVRVKGSMNTTALIGGLAFGLHSFDRSQIHTLNYLP